MGISTPVKRRRTRTRNARVITTAEQQHKIATYQACLRGHLEAHKAMCERLGALIEYEYQSPYYGVSGVYKGKDMDEVIARIKDKEDSILAMRSGDLIEKS